MYSPLFIALTILFMSVTTLSDSYAQERRAAGGVVTKKDNFGEVTINNRSYALDVSSLMLDDRGRYISLKDLELESRVYIEYEETGGGRAVIKLLKVLPQ